MSAEPLRRKAVRAGVHLTLRRIAGLFLSFIGTLFLTRVLGPEAYGAYAAATATLAYFLAVGQQGGRVYLIRLPEGAPKQFFDVVFWWLLVFSGVVGTVLCAVGTGIHFAGGGGSLYASALMLTAFTVVSGNLRGVFAARLEREFEYGKLALIELGGQIASYIVAIPLALRGGGVLALIAGQWTAELFQLSALLWTTRFYPTWRSERTLLRDVISESLKVSSGAWAYELRFFAVPLILLPLAGERGVGYFALAQRLVGSMTMVSDAIAQLSLPIYARLQNRLSELTQAIYRSAQAQLLGFGVLAVAAVVAGYPVLQIIYRAKWDVDVLVLTIALLCIHTMLFVIFGAQAQAMYVIRKTSFMFWLNVLLVACLFPFTLMFTWLIPAPYKPLGFVLGYMLAHQPDHWLLHRALIRWISKPVYGMNLIWAAGLGAAMFAPFTGYWSLLGLMVFLHPASLRAAQEIKNLLLEARGAKQAAPSSPE